MDEPVRYYVRVSGRVQGVGFRYFTQRKAEALGLTGYVRNRPDGDVELEAQGQEAQVQQLLDAVRKGPGVGFVTGMAVDTRQLDPNASTFEIRI